MKEEKKLKEQLLDIERKTIELKTEYYNELSKKLMELKGMDRYNMCKDQKAQIDCRDTECIFHMNASCTNESPAITFVSKNHACWSKKIKNRPCNDEYIIVFDKGLTCRYEYYAGLNDDGSINISLNECGMRIFCCENEAHKELLNISRSHNVSNAKVIKR